MTAPRASQCANVFVISRLGPSTLDSSWVDGGSFIITIGIIISSV
jgi:hypothetical protein